MPKGLSEVIYRNRQAMQWPNEKRQNDKQLNSGQQKATQKTED
jgi:hypothetical protein